MKVMLDVSRAVTLRLLMSEGNSSTRRVKPHPEPEPPISACRSRHLLCMNIAQRFCRDSRVATVGGGTSEIQRNIIAHGLGL